MQNKATADISLLFNERQAIELAGLPAMIQLPSLQGFAKLVGRELNHARRFGTRPAVLLIDVEVREPLGQPVQQQTQAASLLDVLGARLRSRVRGTDVVARIGERRFGVVLQNVERANVHVIQERLQRVLSGAYELAPQPLYASLVSGIAKCECPRICASDLTRAAEVALGQGSIAAAKQGRQPANLLPHPAAGQALTSARR
ncbi:diguanylate cyclase [Paucibacter sp. TC2R-5]|uniref:diguanylate cyclase domain-containing protein n=1 Tax=Paucibacter sp. TC2R-5 TaxID=2893555 RepID=UPI0021E49970|nr:diguanylate cyclase [Paucibacter sp. TC2R-5]MCV2358195.1 diguanylate cyclase [Paucibacter sp. TC2R-5]